MVLSYQVGSLPQQLLVSSLMMTIGIVVPVALLVRNALRERRRQLTVLARLQQEARDLRAAERTGLARDLHDVVAHQLSLATLQITAHADSDDLDELRAVARKVDAASRAAHEELDELVAELPAQPAEADTASVAATIGQLQAQLAAAGHRLVVEFDTAVDAASAPVRRTLVRVLTEATTNILRYAPPSSSCHLVAAADGQISVRMTSPMEAGRTSPLSLGMGLRGIGERVELLGGTFHGGPVGTGPGRAWEIAVRLPQTA